MKKCKQCGQCCQSGIPCAMAQVMFDITAENPQTCPALEYEESRYWCGLIRHPLKWFSSMVGNVKWKCEFMADMTRVYIGIGKGCGISPVIEDVAAEMKNRFCSAVS